MVSLDEGRFPTLELNNRRLSVKNSFCRKNGVYTRSVLREKSQNLMEMIGNVSNICRKPTSVLGLFKSSAGVGRESSFNELVQSRVSPGSKMRTMPRP